MFSVLAAYIVIYLMDLDFSFFQISILLSLSYLTSFLFDIPTGAVADIYGRKVSVVLGFLSTGILVMLIPLSQNYYFILFLFALWGVSHTLITGASDAWVIANLKQKRKTALIDDYYVRGHSLVSLGTIICPLIAAFIVARYSMSWLWFLEGAGIFIAGLILLLPKEKFRRGKAHLKDSLQLTIKQSRKSIKFGLTHPILFKLLAALLFFTFVLAAAAILWQPYLKEFDMPLPWFGYILSLSGALSVAVPFIAQKLSKKFSRTSSYLIIVVAALMVILLSTLFIETVLLAAVVVILLIISMMFYMPIEEPFFQRFVPEKIRATVGSFKNIVGTLGAAVATLIVGGLADLIGVRYTLTLVALLLLPALYFYWRSRKLGH